MMRSQSNWLACLILTGLTLVELAQTCAGTTAGAALPAQASPANRLRMEHLGDQLAAAPDAQPFLPAVEKFLKEHPNDAYAHFLLARLYLRLGYTGLADDELSRTDKLEPGFVLDWLGKQTARPGVPAPTDLFAYVHDHYANDPRAILLHVRLLRASGLRRQALMELARPELAAAAPPGYYSLLSEMSLGDERFDQAGIYARLALAADPTDLQAQSAFLVSAIMRGKSSPDSTQKLAALHKVNPGQAAVATLLAERLTAAGEYKAALEPALVAFVREPGARLSVIENKTLRLVLQKVSDQDIEQTLAGLSPHVLQAAERAWFHLRLAKLLADCGKQKLAAKQFDVAGSLDPFFAGAANFQAGQTLEQKARRPQEALEYYRKAYLVRPYDKQIGAVYTRLDQRLINYQNDLAWRLKDWLLKPDK